MLIRLILPFAYAVLLGCVWGALFKQKFLNSLAPALMTHILLVLVGGMLFGRLSPGIYGGIVLSAVLVVVLLFKNRNRLSRQTIRDYIGKTWQEGGWIFALFYIFCFLINTGKRFLSWDEFTHWGIFLKESLRLDALFCMSPLTFDHKDYVPAITLFEVIWCRLNGRYTEPDAYRAIQIFMCSLLMPMMDKVCAYALEKRRDSAQTSAFTSKKRENRLEKAEAFGVDPPPLGTILAVLLIPLFFRTNDAFSFYHSIYCDLAVGIVFFWCVLEAYRVHETPSYRILILTIGLSVLVLSKMTAMALLPLILALFAVSMFFFGEKPTVRQSILAHMTIVLPVGLWVWFNRFVDRYVENSGGSQSYDGMSVSSIREVFAASAESSIPYVKGVRDAFVNALLHQDILLHGSYVAVILAAAVTFFVMSRCTNDRTEKKKRGIAGIWTIGAGIYYAFLMYFLYCTVFNEYEALRLASYERYMNSFVIAVVLFVVAAVFDSDIPQKHATGCGAVLAIAFFGLALFHADAFDQVLPGSFTHDEETVSDYLSHADAIMAKTGEDARIFIVNRGDNGDFLCHQRYYCIPRTITGGSIGPVVDEGDLWSLDITAAEFKDKLTGYDYVYFCRLDDDFLDRYSDVFSDPALVTDGSLCRITNIDQQIHLEQAPTLP